MTAFRTPQRRVRQSARAYSLTHADIVDQREGAKLLALGMFIGMTGDARFHRNQERLKMLTEE
jgi:hypothetical protein